jgi:glycyl-tRNA synthetase
MGRGQGENEFGVSRLEKYSGIATMEKIVSLAKRRGFVFPSSEIYGGVASSYDYGHYGVLLKQNVKAAWQKSMIFDREDVLALDSAIILNPAVWEASGHAQGFSDPMIDCRTCKARFRADKIPDSHCSRKPSVSPGEGKECDLTDPRQFNLMFKTQIGATEEGATNAFLRPETAQGIFVNFKNVIQSSRKRPPFGIAQIGKSFRNEITPANFLFRMREFEQMEMEFFVPPSEADEWYRYWISERYNWYLSLGLKKDHLRIREHAAKELAHYAKATADIEYLFPIGWSELEGVANRGDYDLKQHSTHSGTTLEWVDANTNERYTPFVIEPAAGADRALLSFLTDSYDEEEVNGEKRTLLRLHPSLAPVKAAILPLIGKSPEQVEIARKIKADLQRFISVEYDEKGAIGRRYRRQDEIGTPSCVTIDPETLLDNAVTVRDRDSMAQVRVSLDKVREYLLDRL